MEGDFIKTNEWLLPFSWLYGMVVGIRNFLFDAGILKSHSFHVPVISVGNITVGGTGKTPHVEYLIRLLKDNIHVAVLSRGYKRKTSGFLLADSNSTVRTIGDEPFQMKQKFPEVTVAVDKDRVEGIDNILQHKNDTDVILLDDAFQHRYVKPGISILLVDYHRLIIYDKLLPAGRLREPLKGKDRADIVIVTKCPKGLRPMDYRVITKGMDLYAYQSLFFTTIVYDALTPLFGGKPRPLESIAHDDHILLITGIASPRQMIEDLSPFTSHLSPLCFDDHHNFRKKDIKLINESFAALPAPKYIITTEKDAVRLTATEGLSEEVRENIYALPVKIEFMLEQGEKFNEKILGYIRKNSKNSILAKSMNDNTSERKGQTIRFK